ncbi:hypothetical protein GPK90_00695 [Clostridium sp. MCC344]|nr:hypothetical protein [Clostridium sp. MCC344]MBT9787888.1 hypothetical protein [Clostridium sp. MCC344]
MNIIEIIIAIIIFVGIGNWILHLAGTVLKWILIGIGIILYIAFYQITIPVTVIILAFMAIRELIKKAKIRQGLKKRQKANKKWLKDNKETFAMQDVDKFLIALVENVYEADKNMPGYKFKIDSLPYGRINAFLSYFGRNIDNTEVYYYSCIPGKKKNDLREYGVIIARSGIFVSQEDSSARGVIDQTLLFSGLKEISNNKNSIFATNISKQNFDDCRSRIDIPSNTIDINSIMYLCKRVINSKVSAAYYENNITDLVQVAENKFGQTQHMGKKKKYVENIAVSKTLHNQQNAYQETKGYMGAAQSHGYAAEYANNTFDRLIGHTTESTAQVLDEHGRQVKNGADRTVDGAEIQTKYYKTAKESVYAAFEEGKANYIGKDGKMMQIEVPRDQYYEALEYMQKKIDSGLVPNIEPGERAENYIRKGYVTYAQAHNICLAGTVEGLVCDLGNGVITSTNLTGISALIVFAEAIWNGENIDDAINEGLSTGVKILGKGAFAYALSMQLSRKEWAIPFQKEYLSDGILKGQASTINPIADMSNKLATQIQNSNLAHSDIGKRWGLDAINGQQIIVTGVSVATYFGPDVYRAMSGKISTDQLTKNTLITAGGIVGGALLEGISVAGGIIGVAAGRWVVQTVMDQFIEDDKVKMFRILKEEYLDTISIAGLTAEELEEVTNNTIANPNLEKILENMFMSGMSRQYAREAIMSEEIVLVMAKRNKVHETDFERGMQSLLMKSA